MAGKGGGAWKVAYADFVTAMMAFFLVMWITAQSTKVKQAIAHYFNQDNEPPKRPFRGPRDESSEPPKFILQPVMPSVTVDPHDPESRVPRVLTIRESDLSSMATVVYFEDGSPQLSDDGRRRLRRMVPWIIGKPHKIEIRGHAPDAAKSAAVSANGAAAGQKPGSFLDAWQLSYARCLAVRSFLESQGVAGHRLRMSQAGANEPLSTNSSDPSWLARNPRVEVFVLTEQIQDYTGTRAERAREEEAH
jgi:chemotaxis protein MotB